MDMYPKALDRVFLCLDRYFTQPCVDVSYRPLYTFLHRVCRAGKGRSAERASLEGGGHNFPEWLKPLCLHAG